MQGHNQEDIQLAISYIVALTPSNDHLDLGADDNRG